MEKKVRILIAGEVSSIASELSLEICKYFEEKKILFKIKSIFKTKNLIGAFLGEDDYDLILIDKNLKKGEVVLKLFCPQGHPFPILFFDSKKEEEVVFKDCLRTIKRYYR